MFVPFELLGDVEGSREVPVDIRSHDDRVTATWQDGSVPQLAQYDSPVVVAKDWPARPDAMA